VFRWRDYALSVAVACESIGGMRAATMVRDKPNILLLLPDAMQTFVKFNPFFYFIDGIRFSMIGISESNLIIGLVMILGLIVVLWLFISHLFSIGWRLRS